MHLTISSLGSALVLSSLCGSAFAFPRLWGSRLGVSPEKRNVCTYDDYLLSLEAFLPDTVPFCSSYLSIPLVTTTGVTTTARTTTTEISTSEVTGVTVTTTDLVTETSTTTITAARGYHKRAPAPSPAARIEATVWLSKIQRDAIADTSIALALSSACSCLSVTPSTTTITPTVSTTRTLSAIDYEYATATLASTTTTIATVIVASTRTGYSSGGLPVPGANGTSTLSPAPYPVNVTSTSSSTEATSSVTPTRLESTMTKSESSTTTSESTSTTSEYIAPTPSAAPAPFVNDGCPAINGTTITTTDGEVYLVLCDTDYIGRQSIGLSEPDLLACVAQCSTTNDGFSATRCKGVSFRPQLVQNCYLKFNLDHPTTNTTYEIVSAILIKELNLPNATNTTSSTNSSSSYTLPTFNTTSPPLGPTATAIIPANLTSPASITPSASMNATTTSAPPYPPSLSMVNSRAEWSSLCSNCPSAYTSTLYSTTTVYMTVSAPSMNR